MAARLIIVSICEEDQDCADDQVCACDGVYHTCQTNSYARAFEEQIDQMMTQCLDVVAVTGVNFNLTK